MELGYAVRVSSEFTESRDEELIVERDEESDGEERDDDYGSRRDLEIGPHVTVHFKSLRN